MPDCFYYELASIIRTAERRLRITAQYADEAFATIAQLPIPATNCQSLIPAAVTFSRTHEISLYDAFYLAHADSLGAIFVTTDDVLLTRAGHLPFVQRLS